MARINAIFDTVPYRSPKVSSFDASHDIKTVVKIGDVTPLDCIPVYPKDNFRLSYATQAKFNSLVAPAFQHLGIKQWSFYCRNSDLWTDFDEFFTGNNPRRGKTAYVPDSTPPSHPHFLVDKGNQFGSSYLGVKLKLTDLDIRPATVHYDTDSNSNKVLIREDVIEQAMFQLGEMRKRGENPFSVHYEDGSMIKRLVPSSWTDLAGSPNNEFQLWFPVASSDKVENLKSEGKGFYHFNYIMYGTDGTSSSAVARDHIEWRFHQRGFKPLFSPKSISDYLGYPVFDFKEFFASDAFDSFFEKKGYFSDKFDTTNKDNLHYFLYDYYQGHGKVSSLYEDNDTNVLVTALRCNDTYSSPFFINENGDLCNINKAPMFFDSFDIPLRNIVCAYIYWMYLNDVNTTMVDDCPYFDLCYFGSNAGGKPIFTHSNERVDSLRVRGYHKIWNDYFRRPDLTAEIPIPFDDGGNDLLNYYNAVSNYFSLTYDGLHLLDWTRNDIFRNHKFNPYPTLTSSNSDGTPELFISITYGLNAIGKRWITSYVVWDLLTNCFKHLRNRDYLTSALPDTSVVDVVTPIGSPESLDNYNNPYSNNQVVDGEFDITNINPEPAQNITSAIGWLDLENLRITQVLKGYFTTLRHTLQGVKDYIKVFFDVDVDDLTVHRSLWLGGNEQRVRISELVGSAETAEAPLGNLGGKADSYGESGMIEHFVKECGFIITLHCLSPLEMNVGGLNRELIRNDKFDYFLPEFSELGDQRIDKKEISIAPTLNIGPDTELGYDKLFGYCQRYLHLKYIPSHVHGDFLGSLSDWHLDLIQPPIIDKVAELTQEWLEEKNDDRIFNDVHDDEAECKIWCACNGTFQRALPIQQFEVLA